MKRCEQLHKNRFVDNENTGWSATLNLIIWHAYFHSKTQIAHYGLVTESLCCNSIFNCHTMVCPIPYKKQITHHMQLYLEFPEPVR